MPTLNWTKHILIFIAVFLLVSMLFQGGQCSPGGGGTTRPPGARIENLKLDMALPPGTASETYTIKAEIAESQVERSQGLAGRRNLEPGSGMLYVYDSPTTPKFSGAGNKFGTSLIYLEADGTIVAAKDMSAGGTAVIEPPEPVRFVLEVRQGWLEDRDAGPGEKFVLPADLAPVPSSERQQPSLRSAPDQTPPEEAPSDEDDSSAEASAGGSSDTPSDED